MWNGCLLLADFLLTHPNLCSRPKETWVELGAGTGLCSVVAALSRGSLLPPEKIFCTDTGDKVLSLCQSNLKSNVSLLKDRRIATKLFVAEVNFLDFDDEDKETRVYEATTDVFHPDVATITILRSSSLFLAADVIFDADVTEGFFHLLVEVMSIGSEDHSNTEKTPKTLYLALEKRVLFSIHDNEEPSSPIYDHFAACLEGLLQMKFETGKFEAERIDVDFPQCFHQSYDRTKYLELWRICFRFC